LKQLFSLHKISVSVLLFVFASNTSAQDSYILPAGADEAGMGYSCVAKPGFWSSFSNPASLASQKEPAAGICYENRFNISELGIRTAGLVIPAGTTTLGVVYSNFGYRYFSRHKAGLASGLNLSEKLAAGVQIDYFYEHVPGENNDRSRLTFAAGALFKASEAVRLGFRIFNPIPGSVRKHFLPASVEAGAEVVLGRPLSATAQAEIEEGKKMRISMGFEYAVRAGFKIRGGFTSGSSSFCFGLGYRVKSVSADLGFMVHDRLGVTSVASVVFNLNRQTNKK
jgi:hypothetical protein